ncbi:MAG: tungstate ABC transporter substrate-binding protein WtpA [Methanobrevibacter sp.]|jgi:molybdate/tungstate transport system substrate-binding protein|nr:tungstate ABC transporter substrate-binding protein WtpA [Candidatus Methanovirga australis]
MNKKIGVLVVLLIVVVGVGVYGYTLLSSNDKDTTLTIYAAASLASQMNTTSKKFEEKHPNVKVNVIYGGSSDLISQITQLNKSADIFASADYGLIDKMIPNSTDLNLQYAHNEMVIAYTDKSKNSSQINDNNWYQILNQSDVKFGIADPNSAPAGYRGVQTLQLADAHYNTTIFEDLIGANSAITSSRNGSGYIINSPNSLEPSSKLVSKPDVAQLMTALESDAVDYVFSYKSEAEQQRGAGVKYITLPGELAISNTSYESVYKNIKLIQFSDTNKSKAITLTPIVYGVTVLNKATNKDLAIEFLDLLLSSDGNKITKDSFQDPIVPAVSTNATVSVPDKLKHYVSG